MINGAAMSTADVGQGKRPILPYQEPLRTWAGRGTGVRCDLCGSAINAQDIEYEVELAHGSAGLAPETGARGLHFHFNCYRLWESQS